MRDLLRLFRRLFGEGEEFERLRYDDRDRLLERELLLEREREEYDLDREREEYRERGLSDRDLPG